MDEHVDETNQPLLDRPLPGPFRIIFFYLCGYIFSVAAAAAFFYLDPPVGSEGQAWINIYITIAAAGSLGTVLVGFLLERKMNRWIWLYLLFMPSSPLSFPLFFFPIGNFISRIFVSLLPDILFLVALLFCLLVALLWSLLFFMIGSWLSRLVDRIL